MDRSTARFVVAVVVAVFFFFFNYRHFRCSPNKTSLFEEQYNVRLDLKISVIGLKAL